MAAESGRRINGTLIRGADGGLYFIPDDRLASFRVPEESAAPAREALRRLTGDVEALQLGRAATTVAVGIHGPFGAVPAAGAPAGQVTRVTVTPEDLQRLG